MRIILFILPFILISCSGEKTTPVEKEIIDDHKGETRYTFSQYFEVEFAGSGGLYSILYDYSKPIDTVFMYSAAQIVGKDSILYARLRKTTSGDSEYYDKNTYFGRVEDLVLYDGKNFNILHPKYFDPHFSSFLVYDSNIYYWGRKNWMEKMVACKYDIRTKKVESTRINLYGETDYFGHFLVPYLENSKVIFETENQDRWELDTETMKILKEDVKWDKIAWTDTLTENN